MSKIKPVVFTITEREVREIAREIFTKSKLSEVQVKEAIQYVECDEFLAKDIHASIVASIAEVIK